jgi:hypothetical protein
MSELKLVKAIIIGDGHIDKKGSIRLHHSKKQEEWLDKKINILNNADIKTRKKCPRSNIIKHIIIGLLMIICISQKSIGRHAD